MKQMFALRNITLPKAKNLLDLENLLITLKRARKWVERASIKTLIINEEANYLTLDVLALR
jgi:hypothetical protein